MANIKVIIFQKNINTDLTKDQKLKIASAKADFLILPRYFPYFEKASDGIHQKESYYLDKILEISEYHKGVVIGGSIIRKIEGSIVESIPIVKDVTLVDYYNYRSGTTIGDLKILPQDGDSIYILNGARFSILPGEDILNPNNMEILKKEKIELVFNPNDSYNSTDEFTTYQKDLKKFFEYSQMYNFNIIRTCGTGKINGKELTGRSFYTSQTGVKWKLGENENQLDIIKTVNVNIFETFPV
jgi:predicted amidohydrolase